MHSTNISELNLSLQLFTGCFMKISPQSLEQYDWNKYSICSNDWGEMFMNNVHTQYIASIPNASNCNIIEQLPLSTICTAQCKCVTVT